jgi:hypothetical protein
LKEIFYEDDRAALRDSEVFSGDKLRERVLFAKEDPNYRLVCFRSTSLELQLHVEPITANIVRAAESAWKGIMEVLRDNDPKLTQLKLIDGQSNREFMSGATGFKTEILRREVLSPVVVAIGVIAYSVIAIFTFARQDPWRFLLGALTGLLPGLVAISFAFLEARKGALRWN